jgi:hypothetical protein
LHAPATNISDSLTAGQFSSGRGVQHRSQVPHHLQQPVGGRYHDSLDESAKRVACGVVVAVVSKTGGERHGLLAKDRRHIRMRRRQRRLGESHRQRRLLLVERDQLRLPGLGTVAIGERNSR